MEASTHEPGGVLAGARAAVAGLGAGGWLLCGLLASVAYAAFFSGAIDIPEESRLQVGVAGLAVAAAAALAAGRAAIPRAGLAWGGVVGLVAFAAWSTLSLGWSVLPDQSWLASNRAFAYAAVAGLGLVAGASAPAAPRLAALGFSWLGVVVALYALGGKVAPGVHLLGVDLDHTAGFSRLRAPIEYWNALGLFVVMAAPGLIWVAADLGFSRRPRVWAAAGLALLVVTAGFTYSRGAVIAFVVVVAVMVGAGADRLRRLAVALAALAAAAPALAYGFSSHDLTTDNLSLADRTGSGAVLGLILASSLLALGLAARMVIGAEGRAAWPPERERRAWRAVAGTAVLGLVLLVVGATTSDRGLGGTVSHQVDGFTRTKAADLSDPARLLSTNGSNRWVWWGEALGAFSDEPLDGWGAGSFPGVHRLYRKNRLEVRQPHSVPLQFLAETGLVGALLGLGGIALLGAGAAAGVRRAAGSDRAARVALTAAAAAWAVHLLYDWDWDIPAVTVAALLAAAVAAAGNKARFGQAPVKARFGQALSGVGGETGSAVFPAAARRGGRLLALAGVSLAALALAVSAALPALSEDRRVAALDLAERSGGDRAVLERAASRAALAHRLDPLSVEPLFTASTIATRRGRLGDAFEYLAKAARVEPGDVRAWRRLLDFQLGTGETRLLQAAGQASVRLDPYGSDPRTLAALALLTTSPYRSPTAGGTPLPPLPRR